MAHFVNPLLFDLFDLRLGNHHNHYTNSGNFPPYEVVQKDEEVHLIHLSVAGYKKENLEIKLDKNLLTIKGKPRVRVLSEMKVLEGSIKRSKFTRTFSLADNVEVLGSNLSDGILTIELKKVIPEEDKPKTIEIP